MEIVIDFPGGEKVDAHFGSYIVKTDQGGQDPSPFSLFLASIGTCAGIYVLGFCKQRGLPTEGIRIIEKPQMNPVTRMVDKINLEIQVPASFPEKYHQALVHTAELCAVKKHLENPPKFYTYTRINV